jgi:hypothetical protein
MAKLSLCLTKYDAMKMYGGDGGEWLVSCVYYFTSLELIG